MRRILFGSYVEKAEAIDSVLHGEFGSSRDIEKICGAGQQVRIQRIPKTARRMRLYQRLEELIIELFALQDLKSDGMLDEEELIRLNIRIAMLHYGKDIDRTAVTKKYKTLFREQLDPDGRPVPLTTFRKYVLQVLEEFDSDLAAQEMILEQFVAEARSARELVRSKSFFSVSDSLANSPCRSEVSRFGEETSALLAVQFGI
jgi:hypothetical protein